MRYFFKNLAPLNPINGVGAISASLTSIAQEEQKQFQLFAMLLGLACAVYAALLSLMSLVIQQAPSATLVGLPVLATFAVFAYFMIRVSPHQIDQHGLTLTNFRAICLEALKFTLPLLLLTVLAKFLLITVGQHSDERLFDMGVHHQHLNIEMFALTLLLYTLLVPVQEFIVRSAVQSSLLIYLKKHTDHQTIAIMISAILYAVTHLHISVGMAIIVFPLGIYWGKLYNKQRSLIGVSLSHIIVGHFGFIIVGFDGILR